MHSKQANLRRRLRSGLSSQGTDGVSVILGMPSGLGGSLSFRAASTSTIAALEVRAAHVLSRHEPRSIRIAAQQRLGRHEPLGSQIPLATDGPLLLELCGRLPGGKGGFGSMLRAAGGKMSAASRKRRADARNGGDTGENDACRDLNGRRLSVMKEARKLAAYLEQEPARRKALDDKMQAKYRRLEKMLGRTPKGREDLEEAAKRMGEDDVAMEDADEFDEDASSEGDMGDTPKASSRKAAASAASAAPAAPAAPAASAAPGRYERLERFDDHEYLEQSREIVSNARSAVAAAMLKKKKMAAASKSAAAKEAQANL